ncbi:hypothetical protein B0H19DRAFT_1242583 [Mycena capillaripes]|nr:hypothetical protein B0H19DRAFT_1242583 [Mycena capillaripes]
MQVEARTRFRKVNPTATAHARTHFPVPSPLLRTLPRGLGRSGGGKWRRRPLDHWEGWKVWTYTRRKNRVERGRRKKERDEESEGSGRGEEGTNEGRGKPKRKKRTGMRVIKEGGREGAGHDGRDAEERRSKKGTRRARELQEDDKPLARAYGATAPSLPPQPARSPPPCTGAQPTDPTLLRSSTRSQGIFVRGRFAKDTARPARMARAARTSVEEAGVVGRPAHVLALGLPRRSYITLFPAGMQEGLTRNAARRRGKAAVSSTPSRSIRCAPIPAHDPCVPSTCCSLLRLRQRLSVLAADEFPRKPHPLWIVYRTEGAGKEATGIALARPFAIHRGRRARRATVSHTAARTSTPQHTPPDDRVRVLREARQTSKRCHAP